MIVVFRKKNDNEFGRFLWALFEIKSIIVNANFAKQKRTPPSRKKLIRFQMHVVCAGSDADAIRRDPKKYVTSNGSTLSVLKLDY